MYSRRDFLHTGITATAAAAAAPLLQGCSQQGDKLRIGYIPITDAAPLLIGHGKGFFAEDVADAGVKAVFDLFEVLIGPGGEEYGIKGFGGDHLGVVGVVVFAVVFGGPGLGGGFINIAAGDEADDANGDG